MAGAGRDARDRRRGKEKEKERERRRRGSGKYGQAKLKHSRMGVHSCACAGGAFALLLISILAAFVMRGRAFGPIGGLGVLSVVLAALGIRAGARGLRERERRYIACKAGLAANALILLGLGAIFLGGLL